MKQIFTLFFALASINLVAQVSLVTEDFEDATVTYTATPAEYSDGTSDFFTRVGGDSPNSVSGGYVVTGFGGSAYFAAQDLDGDGTNPSTLVFSNINIAGATNLNFSLKVAEDDASGENWDGDDSFIITYSIDGGAAQNLFAVEASSNGSNVAPAVDTNFDGQGDGTTITSAFQTFTGAIAGTGSTMTITMTFDLNAGDEDIAIDDFEIQGTPGGPPTVAWNASTYSVAEGNAGNTTLTADITMNFAPSDQVVVDVVTVGGTATENVDYTGVSTTVTFETTDTYPATKPVTVNIIGDTDFEPDETFSLLLDIQTTDETFATEGTNTAMVTIQNDDADPSTFLFAEDFDGTSTWTNDAASQLFVDPTSNNEGLFIQSGTNLGPDNVLFGRDITGELGEPTRDPLVLTFSTVNVSNATNVVVRFSYDLDGFDSADDLSYDILVDGTSASSNTFTGDAAGTVNFSVPDAASSVSLTVTVDQNGGGDSFELDDFQILGNGTAILPVRVGYFEATATPLGNHLTWTTTTELNNDHFNIQRSPDAKTWQTVGRVAGNGTTEQETTYEFLDRSAPAGLNYYRLQQVDYDGAFEYFGPIVVRTSSKGTLNVFPNPTTDALTIVVDAPASVVVTDLTGQEVATYRVDATDRTTLATTAWEAGMYLVTVRSSTGTQTVRVVKR